LVIMRARDLLDWFGGGETGDSEMFDDEAVPFTDVIGELGSAMIPDGETGERRFGTVRQVLEEYIPDYGETDEPQYTEGSPLTNFRHGELIE